MSNSTKGNTMTSPAPHIHTGTLQSCELRKRSENKLATCGHCGTTRRAHFLTRQWFDEPNGLGVGVHAFAPVLVKERVKVNGIGRHNSEQRGLLTCCGHKLNFEAVKGKLSDHVCADKCRSATGPACSCSCGGKNHGQNHATQWTR